MPANPRTFFQMYWTGSRDVMVQRMERARAAGAKGLIATLDWSFSIGRDWGSPRDPGEGRPQDDGPDGAAGVTRPRWLLGVRQDRPAPRPDRPQPRPARQAGADVLRRLLRVDDDPAADLGGRRVDARAVGRAVHAQGRLPGRRRPAGGRRRGHRDLGVQPRRQQPRRHPGRDPDAARHRRRGRRPGRGGHGRRDPPRLRRGQGGRARCAGGDDRPRLPVGAGRQRAGRRRERPRHPARRHRLGADGPGPVLDARPVPDDLVVRRGSTASSADAEGAPRAGDRRRARR